MVLGSFARRHRRLCALIMTMFWIITAGLTALVAAILAVALIRRKTVGSPAAAYDIQVYRDQLKEVDRDLARGVLSQVDAERVRTEVSRRILAADAAMQAPAAAGGSVGRTGLIMPVLVALIMAGATYGIYTRIGAPGYGDLALSDRIEFAEIARRERPSQADAEASLPEHVLPPDASPDYVALVTQLRETVAERQDDVQGHELLARAEARLGNFGGAHRAQARVIALKGPEASVQDLTDYADMLILAAGGYVSPEAEDVLDQVLARDEGSGPGRYYYGLMMAQTGRPDIAFRIWDALLRAGPPDAPWIEPIVTQIEDLARRAGVAYQLPEIGTGRGPSQDDIEAAQDMTPVERMEMIEGMVGRLSDRLATEGGPAEDWAQLIGALGVLGRMEQAQAVFFNAQEVFADAPGAMDLINRAAERVGLQ